MSVMPSALVKAVPKLATNVGFSLQAPLKIATGLVVAPLS
jgi:hypothetical protein